MKTKSTIIVSLLFALTISINAQTKKTRALMETISKDYKIENNNVVYEKIIELNGKKIDELFYSGLDFLENFTDSQIQIISNDMNRGKIKAWGFLNEFHSEKMLGVETKVGASYNISVDVKDGKSRIRITAVDYFKEQDRKGLSNAIKSIAGEVTNHNLDLSTALYQASGELNQNVEGDIKIRDTYPISSNSGNKNLWGRSFFHLNNHILEFMEMFGNYMKNNVNDEW